MDVIVPFLAFGTIGAVIAFAWISQIRTDERRRSAAPKSTLAADSPDRAPEGRRPADA